MKDQKQRYLFKTKSNSGFKIPTWLFMLWPVIVAIVGFFIMYFAGALNCQGCNFFDFSWASYIAWWGWIGFGFAITGLGFGGYRIFIAIKNSIG